MKKHSLVCGQVWVDKFDETRKWVIVGGGRWLSGVDYIQVRWGNIRRDYSYPYFVRRFRLLNEAYGLR